MDVHFDINGQTIKSSKSYKKLSFAAGSSNFIKFHFNFSEDWNGLDVVAHFYKDKIDSAQSRLSNFQMYLPGDISIGNYVFVLIGSDYYGNIVATTSGFDISIVDNLFILQN